MAGPWVPAPTKWEEDESLLCPAPFHAKLISSQGNLSLAEFVTYLHFPFCLPFRKKGKKKYIYIYILCGGPCVRFKTVEPACKVCHRQEYPSRGSVLEETHQWSLYEVTRERVTPFSHPHRPSFMERPGGICET